MVCQELKSTEFQLFTDLIRELYCLFQSLCALTTVKNLGFELSKEHASNIKKLRDCKEVIQLMKDVAAQKDWPEV